ncbi:ImmA/IrrE family metallo-endopeptidase [Bacillus licheniformis]|uniref:ImmA/IrrE family metallo-endopeptidase n=1 Tax=Bacillus licheniformis TaxID=1402 RepID=UPI0011A2E2BC|nr:ImmA/IrrE family metallo-endopeptidase [Bacillus licheniformis]MCA1184593.1 ImmA/IrrE family metallo-endopeptidase [Bacillus licheniformis]
MGYLPSRLEISVSNLLLQKGIKTPIDLQPKILAERFNIDLQMSTTSFAFTDGNTKIILLNRRADEKERNYEFHKLFSHILLHSGNHLEMDSDQYRRQDKEAQELCCLEAIPYHMLRFIDFSNKHFITQASERFRIPEKIVETRIQFMVRKQLTQSIKEQIKSFA